MRIILLLFLLGCGDSPFINKDISSEVRGTPNLENELVLPGSGIVLKIYWNQGPMVSDESKLTIILLDKSGRPIDPSSSFNLMLWMPTMGHGSFPVSVKRLSQGVYEAFELYFTMEGYWDIHFQLMDGEKVLDEVKWGLEL